MADPEKVEMVTVRCLMQVTDDALHQPGDVIEVPADQVESLVEVGAVEVVEPEPETGTEPPPAPEPEPEPTPPKPKPRARRKTKTRSKRSS
ncbi:MAG: hypothetical protein F4112_16010 [Holophagales bacterium]|nr:hypothetical protein [Holophagales bacterium]MYB20855.1 hypothetical protein [Holophagales bacterium]MYD22000.1 hypothetical protein [Holophagales bacterium]MYH25495.1 hypothetical protein [Holophagales bacterium]MYI34453.1 hypothetical protein [Holophagales bacterium]